ncbi:MAG: PEP-CTERM sorting domain-containing protein [Litoreibacter sp.]
MINHRLATAIVLVSLPFSTSAATFNVLWWDTTPEFSGQAPNSNREEMSNYIDAYDGGALFDSKYVDVTSSGGLETELSTGAYDVVIFDSTDNFGSGLVDADDIQATKDFYSSGKSDLMLDGSLYIRNIEFNDQTDFPGPTDAIGGLLINQVAALARAGGGLFFGTDHNCCQGEINSILDALAPNMLFSGSTNPSTDGVFNGSTLLNEEVAIAASDVLAHWDAVPSQGIAPTGQFTDFLGNGIELFSHVDVADEPGGGQRFSYISSTINPGGGTTDVDDDTPGGTGGGVSVVPVPAGLPLLATGILTFFGLRRRKT